MPKMQATQTRLLDWLSSLLADGSEPHEAGAAGTGGAKWGLAASGQERALRKRLPAEGLPSNGTEGL